VHRAAQSAKVRTSRPSRCGANEQNLPADDVGKYARKWRAGSDRNVEEKRQRPVQQIDFENPGANVFHITWEWKLTPPGRKGNRADVMFVINGVPVTIVEHKNPKDGGAIDRGVIQLRRYEKETPELIGMPQLFNRI
jgi:type I site-specific restriction-modification system R (restriction) subunit